MVHSAIILAFFALAVHGAPRENRDHDGAHRVIWVPVPADTTVAAPTNTATSPTRANGCAAEFYSVGREDDKMAAMLVQGARSTKPDQAAVVQFASTTISRPSKVTSVATRTVSSNKLSPTGTSTTTMTTTVTMPGKRPSETPSRGPDNGVETKTRRNVFYVENWGAHGANFTVPLYNYEPIAQTPFTLVNARSASIEGNYLRRLRLNGVVVWEPSDDRPSEDSLTVTLSHSMRRLQSSRNMLNHSGRELASIQMLS
ncbi:hypothetical protein BB8028_0001g08130 [Beauveria bassiana]|uniref:Uncharacterized protein n=2 Tax=Beauveria bassiana TaxID=176275 RepID=A0A0A2VR02_BEABA|nr:hypothetical protein BBAD15_g5878 [Beauveria bassiana D1-5]PQK08740.1 hypothetical protein BB8028_0001g08130 [Beauveria bassiana]